jgi:hypothetical protein
VSAHVHKLNKDKFIAEMAKRGWQLDPNGWIIPEGRRIHQRESDWLASILLAIECECPVDHQQESAKQIPIAGPTTQEFVDSLKPDDVLRTSGIVKEKP